MSDTSMVAKIAKLLDVDTDAVDDRLTDLDLDRLLDIADATSHGDAQRIRTLLGLDADDAETTPTEDKDEDEEHEINPLFSKDAPEKRDVERKARKAADDEIDEEDFYPNMGEQVLVDGEEGITKVPRGPHDTVGVQLDGEMQMINRKAVKRDVSESMMGMAGMSGLARMQQLAGLAPTSAAGPDAVEIEIAPPPCNLASGALAPGLLPGAEAAMTPVDAGLTQVLQSFTQIEAAIPDMRVRDARVVRQRINALLAKLNESAKRMRRKI